MRFFGLIGKSLEHSFSPVYFKEKFEKEGITDCFYNLYPLKFIDEFNQLISDFTELSGLNVTIPYKKEIIPFLDEINDEAKKIGAVNTIKFDWLNNKLKLTGFNTDYLGFMDSIKPHLNENHKLALILGTGGSSEAVKFGLNKLGINFKQVSREPREKNTYAYNEITKEVISDYKLIVNTTPLGMYPNISQCPDIPYGAVTDQHLLYDLIYNPKQTEFLGKGSVQGAQIKNGYEMLIKQAEFSWKIWNNIPF